MTGTAPSVELAALLTLVEAALGRGDHGDADVQMQLAADLCQRLEQQGVTIAPRELAPIQDLATRCGDTLVKLADELNAESLRDGNHRRGVSIYHDSQNR